MQTRKAPPKPAPRPASRPPQARKAAPSKPHMENANPVLIAVVALVVIAALVGGYLLQYVAFPDGLFPDRTAQGGGAGEPVTEIAPTTAVRINEIMSSNGTAWSDEHGEFGDWVEITNTSSTETIDISGWILTDTANALNAFTFPQQTLAPGEFVLVFCDGTLHNTPGYTYHAPFKLSSDGDTLLLFNRDEIAVESINIPSLNRNQSYARVNGGWQVTSSYTPCMPNEEQYHQMMREALSGGQTSSIVVSEIMADNATYIRDEDGEYCDWIEIANTGSSAVNLSGWCLSDDTSNPTKWRFPNVTIAPGEHMVVYCSGKNRAEAGANLHTSFRLGAEGEMAVLSNAQGVVQSSVSYTNLKTDRSLSLYEGNYTTNLAPTPGAANTAASAAAQAVSMASANPYKVYISEVSAGTSRTVDTEGTQPEWIEIINKSTVTVDLSGWGLSDNAGRPRKWQFADGASIKPGQYLIVKLGESDVQDVSSGSYQANFGLSLLADADETVTLCTPDGSVVDRMPLPRQYASISYGRIDGQDGFFYLAKSTPGSQNNNTGYALRTDPASFSIAGGMYDGAVTVELSAQENATIRYTTDGSVPTTSSPVYTGPITLNETTVLRSRVWRDQEYPSATETQTYFVGVSHTMNVMSVVVDPADLWSQEKGLYVLGPNAMEYPYGSIDRGANFWMTWEKSANVEYYGTDGSTILSQGCGLKLHGQYSRSEPQKAFKIIAREEYDEQDFFYAPLFSERDYTQYQSFVLRSSGSDGDKTRMRDSILTSLAENTPVMYQATELVVVYLNGQYWGQYNLRERINQYSVAQWEGWDDPENVDLVKANSNVLHGSDESYQKMLAWVKKNGVKSDEALAAVGEVVDLENFIDYICLQMFTGNTDTLNVKRYRNAVSGDGRWRWIFFDLDWAFYTDTNSPTRWMNPAGMGNSMRTNNTLYVELMKNDTFRAMFLKRLGELMATDFTTQAIVDKVNARINELMPEMANHMPGWQNIVNGWLANNVDTLPASVLSKYTFDMDKWKSELSRFIDYAEERPTKMIQYMQDSSKDYSMAVTKEELNLYFADAIQAIYDYKEAKK
ncbi:MAG: lamin tail domain-containing protein [Clostridia bacterium]|nr:lamin tail domain-containing protein [Clostridia bacterium]